MEAWFEIFEPINCIMRKKERMIRGITTVTFWRELKKTLQSLKIVWIALRKSLNTYKFLPRKISFLRLFPNLVKDHRSQLKKTVR